MSCLTLKSGLAEAAKIFDDYTEAKNKRESANANKVHQQPHLKPPLFSRRQNYKTFFLSYLQMGQIS